MASELSLLMDITTEKAFAVGAVAKQKDGGQRFPRTAHAGVKLLITGEGGF